MFVRGGGGGWFRFCSKTGHPDITDSAKMLK